MTDRTEQVFAEVDKTIDAAIKEIKETYNKVIDEYNKGYEKSIKDGKGGYFGEVNPLLIEIKISRIIRELETHKIKKEATDINTLQNK